MTEHDGARPVGTAPDSTHVVTDDFAPPSVETRPLELQPAPDVITLPDPTRPEDGCFPTTATREELEMALRRAQLVADDCAALLDPAQRAMEDGAWVSRLADEFSTGLMTHARMAATIADGCVETIQTALDTRGEDEPLEVHT